MKELIIIRYIDISNGEKRLNGPKIVDSLDNFFITSSKFTEQIFFFSRPPQPAVVIGLNQDVFSEVNLNFIHEHNIQLSRRFSGGGAVFVDPGDLNYTFIDNDDGTNCGDFKRYAQPVISTLKKLGIDAKMTGRNDLTVDGKKVSGMSALKIGNRFLCGGTLMVDVDLAAAAKALTPPKAKLQSKGIKSVHSRVTNIRQFFDPKYKNITMEELQNRILLQVFHASDLRDIPIYTMTDDDWKAVLAIADKAYTGDDFVMGEKPNDDYFRGRHFDGVGTVEISFSVQNDVVTHAKIYGDFNNPNGDLKAIEANITNVPFAKASLTEAFRTSHVKENIGNVDPEALAEMMVKDNYDLK
nr:lipoate--protein ligase [Lentilactobacillus parabuchneri]